MTGPLCNGFNGTSIWLKMLHTFCHTLPLRHFVYKPFYSGKVGQVTLVYYINFTSLVVLVTSVRPPYQFSRSFYEANELFIEFGMLLQELSGP